MCVCVFVDVCVYVCACVLTLFLPIVTPLTLLFIFLPDKGHGIAMCKYGVSDLVKYKFHLSPTRPHSPSLLRHLRRYIASVAPPPPPPPPLPLPPLSPTCQLHVTLDIRTLLPAVDGDAAAPVEACQGRGPSVTTRGPADSLASPAGRASPRPGDRLAPRLVLGPAGS